MASLGPLFEQRYHDILYSFVNCVVADIGYRVVQGVD